MLLAAMSETLTYNVNMNRNQGPERTQNQLVPIFQTAKLFLLIGRVRSSARSVVIMDMELYENGYRTSHIHRETAHVMSMLTMF